MRSPAADTVEQVASRAIGRVAGARIAPARRDSCDADVMRRPFLLAVVLPLLLVIAPDALAAAGGGSSGFGGGGGGGGGGGFSGGGGGSVGTGGSISTGGFVLIVIALILFFGFSFFAGLRAERRRRKKRDARSLQSRAAALEASQDDAAFDPDHIGQEAMRLFATVQMAWTARDQDQLRTLCGPDLMVEWQRRLDDFASRGWHNQVTIQGTPTISLVGVVNRESDDEDRVVVLVEATLNDVVVDRNGALIPRKDSDSATTTLREYWTLAKRDGVWTLRSIEQLGEGDHNLDAPLVASPFSDDRIREDSVLEGAVADAAAPGTDVAALVDLDYAADGRKAALDLSLVDGRFAPDVLETCARRAVAAWAEAVDGADDALLAVASTAAVHELLYPTGGDAVRRVVRGPAVERMTLVALDGSSQPARMTVELALRGRRYLENRDTVAVVDGSRDRETRWTEHWSFVLDDTGETPWHLAGAGDVAQV